MEDDFDYGAVSEFDFKEALKLVREECKNLDKKISLMIFQQTSLGANLGELRPMVFDLIKEQTAIIRELQDMIKTQNSVIIDLAEEIFAMNARIEILEGAAGIEQDLV